DLRCDASRSRPCPPRQGGLRRNPGAARREAQGWRVRRREVVFAPEARDDLRRLYEGIATAAGMSIALAYIERIETYCLGFDRACEVAHVRNDFRPGVRCVGVEARATMAFSVDDGRVTILRVFYGGQDWENAFR